MDQTTLPLSPDAFGWLAAALTWLTFFCKDMRRLRYLALGANAAFIAYAAMVQLWPVLVLHLALVPVNLWRLTQLLLVARTASAQDRQAPDSGSGAGRVDGQAAVEQVAVAADLVQAADRAPVLLAPQRGQRAGRVLAGVGARPFD
jgi:hypothetical protein